jgi:hypothetical protein
VCAKLRGKFFLRTFLPPEAPLYAFRPVRRAENLPMFAPERPYFAGKPPFARLRPGCGVCPSIPKGFEPNAFLGDSGKRVEQVAGAAGQSVQPRHHQDVTGYKYGEHLAQLRAVGFGSARNFTIDVDRACGCQCRYLRLDALAVRGDSRLAVHHDPIMHIYFAQRKPHGISQLFSVQKS